jgi:hypothetical protein
MSGISTLEYVDSRTIFNFESLLCVSSWNRDWPSGFVPSRSDLEC